MPLAFESLSHGTIAFGFFNIESDMLLLERYFLFADAFCRYVEDIAVNAANPSHNTVWKVQFIDSADAIGDLTGAIHGINHTGFIGDLYRRFPFPARPQDFKQNPRGFKTQAQVSEILAAYAAPREIEVTVKNDNGKIHIGDYRFNNLQFHKLIEYVWRGGLPRWQADIRPAYVSAMRENIRQNRIGILKGIAW
jgi:hypothetical protein